MTDTTSAIQKQPKKPLTIDINWNPAFGVFYVITVFFLSQIFAAVLVQLLYSGYGLLVNKDVAVFEGSVAAQFLFILIAEAISIGLIYYFLHKRRISMAAIGLKKPKASDFAYGLAAVPVYLVLYVLTVGIVSSLVSGLDVNQEQQIGFDNVSGTLPLVLTFISLAILPPLAEEIMVRGFLYSSLKKAMKLVPAVILTSAIFASAHLQGGLSGPLWIAALDTFVLSLVLIYLREKTGSLWASITLHAIKNSVAFVALFILNA